MTVKLGKYDKKANKWQKSETAKILEAPETKQTDKDKEGDRLKYTKKGR